MRRPGARVLGLLAGVLLFATAGTAAAGIAYAHGTIAPTTLVDVVSASTTKAAARGATKTAVTAAAKAAAKSAAETAAKTAALPAGAAVGPLFTGGTLSGSHSCTASVVSTAAGDVLVTAAHCLSGTGAGTLFAPGYRTGVAPYGTWVVQKAYVSTAWASSQNAADDVAFLVVTPSSGNATKASVQSVVGAETLATTPAAGTRVTVTGYAQGAGGSAIVCTAAMVSRQGSPTFDCGGYVGGTSGGPWVTSGGQVVGVIGGLQQGGCVANVSYSSAFTSATQTLLKRAAAGGAGDTLPVAGASGC